MIWGGELMTELKRSAKEKEWKKEKRRKQKGCILFIHWPRGDPGTPALYLLWHWPMNIMGLMNIYLYIFLDLLCTERSCLAWPACNWTIWFSPGQFWRTGRSPEAQHALKTGLHSLICDSSALVRACRRGWAVKLCRDLLHGRRQRWQNVLGFSFLETFLRTAK